MKTKQKAVKKKSKLLKPKKSKKTVVSNVKKAKKVKVKVKVKKDNKIVGLEYDGVNFKSVPYLKKEKLLEALNNALENTIKK